MSKKTVFLLWCLLCSTTAFAQKRTFNDVFPGVSEDVRKQVFSPAGYAAAYQKSSGFSLLPSAGLEPEIPGRIRRSNPDYLIETLLVIPGGEGVFEITGVYNALRQVRALKGRLYHSATRDADIPLFEDATRIDPARRNAPLPDPPPAASAPQSETVYLCLKDANFGNSYYRGDISLVQQGLLYRLSNYKNLSYLFVPVIKAGKFMAQLYFEPLEEGILVYGIAGAEVSNFISSNIDVPSAIEKRFAVILSWVIDGILG
jgi:hypothetical protein